MTPNNDKQNEISTYNNLHMLAKAYAFVVFVVAGAAGVNAVAAAITTTALLFYE